MGLYSKFILPTAIDFACKHDAAMRQRAKVIPWASGNVLEIGIGSGLNLPIYDLNKVKHLTAIDPSVELWNKSKVDTGKLSFDFEFIRAFAEDIPADNYYFDTVVMTYSLCSISDTSSALEEIRRVLKPNGKFIFCEHGKAPDKIIQRWQNVMNPFWKRIGGGCNLNRDIPLIIGENGFKMSQLETMYVSGWKPVSFNYWGIAESF